MEKIGYNISIYTKWKKRRQDRLNIAKLNAISAYLEASKAGGFSMDIYNKVEVIIKSL